ncbi:MAG: pilus assembly protein CpaE [Chloroflexota bacterium]
MNQITMPLPLAQELKAAGLVWQADINDFFGIPDRDLDDRVFVVADLMANLELFRGWPVVSFHGAAEWALDYIFTSEVVWLPTEGQARQELEDFLLGEENLQLQVTLLNQGYRCEILFQGSPLTFQAATAVESYGKALLHLLQVTNEQG